MRRSTRFSEDKIAEIIAVRDEKGWDRTAWDNFPVRMMAIMSEVVEIELSESIEEFELELADVAIYVLSILHDFGHDSSGRTIAYGSRQWGMSLADATFPLRNKVREAYERWRRNEQKDALICLELLMLELLYVAHSFGVDIDQAIEDKLNVLRSRDVRHGGKHPSS